MRYDNLKQRNVVFAASVMVIYGCFTFLTIKLAWDYRIFVPLSYVNGDTVITRLFFDSVLSVPYITSLLVLMKSEYFTLKPRWEFENGHVVALLFAFYVFLCLYKQKMSVNGFYLFGFYLFFVGFVEEFIFRGFLFLTLNNRYEWKFAAFVAGIFWSIPHLFIPLITSNDYMHIEKWVSGIINGVGGFAVSSIFFSWLLLKGKNLFIPVLVHAILDYLGA